jgi:hypothetical protein
MDSMKHYHSYYGDYGRSHRSPLMRLLMLLIMSALLLAAAGVTWLALTPLDAPTINITREVPADKLGPQ